MHFTSTLADRFGQFGDQFADHRRGRFLLSLRHSERDDETRVRRRGRGEVLLRLLLLRFATRGDGHPRPRGESRETVRFVRVGFLQAGEFPPNEIFFLPMFRLVRIARGKNLLRKVFLSIVNSLVTIDQDGDQHARRRCTEQGARTSQDFAQGSDRKHVAVSRRTIDNRERERARKRVLPNGGDGQDRPIRGFGNGVEDLAVGTLFSEIRGRAEEKGDESENDDDDDEINEGLFQRGTENT